MFLDIVFIIILVFVTQYFILSQKMAEQKSLNNNQSKCVEFSKYIVKAQEEQIELLKQLASNSNTKGLFY